MAIRQIDDYSLRAIANSIRRKLSTTEEFTLEKMPEKIDGIADYPRADDSTFGKVDDVPAEREPVYIVDSEDLNELGALAQKMAGKKALMSIEDMIYWLGRVQFIPRSEGSSDLDLRALIFNTDSNGTTPQYNEDRASTILSMDKFRFNTSAMGDLVIQEENT